MSHPRVADEDLPALFQQLLDPSSSSYNNYEVSMADPLPSTITLTDISHSTDPIVDRTVFDEHVSMQEQPIQHNSPSWHLPLHQHQNGLDERPSLPPSSSSSPQQRNFHNQPHPRHNGSSSSNGGLHMGGIYNNLPQVLPVGTVATATAAATAPLGTQLSPHIVKITNTAPSATFGQGMASSTASATAATCTPGIIGDVVVYILGERNRHREYQAMFKSTHKRFARAVHETDRQHYHHHLMEGISQRGGVFLTESGQGMTVLQIQQLVWKFLKQKCFVDYNPHRDVSGRGGTATHAVGHQRYTRKRNEWGATYTHASTDDYTKRQIAQLLVDWVYREGGQFVRKCKMTNQCYILENKEALKRAMQSLCEYKAPDQGTS